MNTTVKPKSPIWNLYLSGHFMVLVVAERSKYTAIVSVDVIYIDAVRDVVCVLIPDLPLNFKELPWHVNGWYLIFIKPCSYK